MSQNTTAVPEATLPARPRDLSSLLGQIGECSRDEKKQLLDRLLRDIFGEKPEGEWSIRNPDGSAYLHVLAPVARAMLFCTPERIAFWKSEDLSKVRPNREFIDILLRGDEEEVRAYLKQLND